MKMDKQKDSGMDRSARLVGILGVLFAFMYAVTLGGLFVEAGTSLMKRRDRASKKGEG